MTQSDCLVIGVVGMWELQTGGIARHFCISGCDKVVYLSPFFEIAMLVASMSGKYVIPLENDGSGIIV